MLSSGHLVRGRGGRVVERSGRIVRAPGGGQVLVIGGHEDHEGRREILWTFVRAARGDQARVAVVTTASGVPDRTGEEYRAEFESQGVQSCDVYHLADRSAAGDPRTAAALSAATGIFFTGGDQLRITAVLGGTPVESAIRHAYRRGAVIAGTSAGASAMSASMIVGGRSDASTRREIVRMAPGLGYLPDLVIDQHFAQRGRTSRLLAILGQNPSLLGVGVDEDTAFLVGPDRILRVVGTNTVTILDGRNIRLTTASEADLDQPLTLTHVTLHVLSEGHAFDLRRREPLLSGDAAEGRPRALPGVWAPAPVGPAQGGSVHRAPPTGRGPGRHERPRSRKA